MTTGLRQGAHGKPALLYIDMAYDLAELARQNRQGFLNSRNRGGLFGQVYSIHPVAGLTEGAAAGRARIVRPGGRQIVIDGFRPAPSMAGARKLLNLFSSQVRMWSAAVRIARRPQVRLVVASDIFYLGLMALFAAKMAGKPLSVAAYQNQDELYAQSGRLAFPRLLPWRFLERLIQQVVLRSADIVEAPTENMRRYLVNNGARPGRIAILPVARFIEPLHLVPPEDRISPDVLLRQWNIDPAAPRMVMISRLIELKLVRDGLEAMIGACAAVDSAVGLILGEGELAPALQARIEQAGMTARIVLAGNVDQDALSRLCVGATIISPLTGMALVEACLAGGVPVAYDRDWQPEFVMDGRNGYIVPFRDAAAMADRGAKLMCDPALFAEMSAASRATGLAFADPVLHQQRELAVFSPLVARPPDIEGALR